MLFFELISTVFFILLRMLTFLISVLMVVFSWIWEITRPLKAVRGLGLGLITVYILLVFQRDVGDYLSLLLV